MCIRYYGSQGFGLIKIRLIEICINIPFEIVFFVFPPKIIKKLIPFGKLIPVSHAMGWVRAERSRHDDFSD